MAMDSSKDIEWNKQLEYMWKLENNRMNNEIKEIPENVRFVLEDINSNILWNYITNLQEENEIQKEKIEHLLIDLRGESEYKKRNEKAIDFINIYTDGINLEAFDCLKLMYKIRDILEGENNE